MKVAVDRAKCLGQGVCEAKASDIFGIGDDAVVVIFAENVAPDRLATVRAAVEGCPNQALSLVED
jgi:ferredoxin